MAIGDGVTWNEALPDNSTVAHQIDDYNRDLRVGVRSRMALEHVWPSSHTGTGSGGRHTFITFQAQTAAPPMTGTTGGGLYVTTDAQPALMYVASDGTETMVINTAGGFGTGTGVEVAVITGGTQGSIPICSSANEFAILPLAASADGYVLTTHTTTGNPTWEALSSQVGFGAWESKTNTTTYLAATDGIVVGYKSGAGTMQIITDSNSSPSVVRYSQTSHSQEGASGGCCPVKKGDYWKATGADGALWWLPLGS